MGALCGTKRMSKVWQEHLGGIASSAPRSCRLPTSLCITTFLVTLLNLLVYLLRTGTNICVPDRESMVSLVLTSGITFVILVLTLILICWTSHIII